MSIIFWFHSLWRWVVLVTAIAAALKALIGWLGRQEWRDVDNKLGLYFTMAFDVQLLLGVVVYIGTLTSLHAQIWYQRSVALLTMEHVTPMVVAAVIVHVARSLSKKGTQDTGRHRTAAIGFLVALLLVVVSIPHWGVSAQL